MLYNATWNNIKQVVHVYTIVGWVSKISGTCWIWFSQNNLQNILVSLLIKKEIMQQSRVSIF
jgi:hypothetical protein